MDELVFPQGIKVEELTAIRGKISIEPVERGFATTLGNSLRRVLLTAIPGAAVVRVRLSGKYHEYDTIEGVQEDVLEIILNLKTVALRMQGDEMQRLNLAVKGPMEVSAANIECPPGVQIVNPDQHIATLGKGGALDIEIEVEAGFGYVSSEANGLEDSPLSVIPVDADFSPVRQVNFVTEETRVGGRTGYERLVLELTTNGGISPEEALSEASRILKRHLELFNDFAEHPYGIAMDESEVSDAEEMSISLSDLGIDQRACNLLQEADIVTLKDLLTRPREELLDIHGFGGKTLSKVEERLEELGYSLRSEGDIRHEA
jgi:DNA-directed RNA polymerase subunit alpha